MRFDIERLPEWSDQELNDTWEALSAQVSKRRRELGELGELGELFETVGAEYTRRHPLEGFRVSYRRYGDGDE